MVQNPGIGESIDRGASNAGRLPVETSVGPGFLSGERSSRFDSLTLDVILCLSDFGYQTDVFSPIERGQGAGITDIISRIDATLQIVRVFPITPTYKGPSCELLDEQKSVAQAIMDIVTGMTPEFERSEKKWSERKKTKQADWLVDPTLGKEAKTALVKTIDWLLPGEGLDLRGDKLNVRSEVVNIADMRHMVAARKRHEASLRQL